MEECPSLAIVVPPRPTALSRGGGPKRPSPHKVTFRWEWNMPPLRRKSKGPWSSPKAFTAQPLLSFPAGVRKERSLALHA